MSDITLKEKIENHITNTYLTTEQKANRILKEFLNTIDSEIKRYNDNNEKILGLVDHSVLFYNNSEKIEGLEEFKENFD